MFDSFIAMTSTVVGGILLAVALPFAASLILDGLIIATRRRRFAPLVLAVALTAGVTIVGAVTWNFGLASSVAYDGMTAFPVSMTRMVQMLLPFAIALGLIGFGIRMARMLADGGRSSTSRPASRPTSRV